MTELIMYDGMGWYGIGVYLGINCNLKIFGTTKLSCYSLQYLGEVI